MSNVCAGCGQEGIAAITTPDGRWLCVNCKSSLKASAIGPDGRLEVELPPQFWKRIVIHKHPQNLEYHELAALKNQLSQILLTVECDLSKSNSPIMVLASIPEDHPKKAEIDEVLETFRTSMLAIAREVENSTNGDDDALETKDV